jgi:hypothetical protein
MRGRVAHSDHQCTPTSEYNGRALRDRSADAELVTLRVVYDHEVARVVEVVVMRASLNAGPQPGQFGHLCVNDLHPPFQRQRVVAAGGVKIHVHAVLASLGLDPACPSGGVACHRLR